MARFTGSIRRVNRNPCEVRLRLEGVGTRVTNTSEELKPKAAVAVPPKIEVTIDSANLEQRILALPILARHLLADHSW